MAPSGSVVSLEARLGEEEYGGTFAKVVVEAGAELALPPGKRLRVDAEEWTVKVAEETGLWEARERIDAGEAPWVALSGS